MSVTNLSLNNNTLIFDLTPTNINNTILNISNIIPTDGSGIFNLNYTIQPVNELLFTSFKDTNTLNIITKFIRNTTYNLTIVFNKTISNSTSYTIEAVNESNILSTDTLQFTWTPTINRQVVLGYVDM